MSAVAAEARSAIPPRFSPDGSWYWDGHRWQATISADGRWRWDGRRWAPRGASLHPDSRAASSDLPIALLAGLAVLDLAGIISGLGVMASVAAAVAVLAIDARGLVTLNGLIKWRRMSFRFKVATAFVELLFFQFLVLAYLGLRLLGIGKRALWAQRVDRRAAVAFDAGVVVAGTDVSATELNVDAIQRALNALLSDTRNRLPQDLYEKVVLVVAAIEDVLAAGGASGLSQHDRFVVERTAHDYLPTAVRNYLKLPQAYRSNPLPDADGKTAREVLAEQLDLLARRVRQIADMAYRQDVEALLVHGRFLQSKFGKSSLSLSS